MNAVVRRNWLPADQAQTAKPVGQKIDDENLRNTVATGKVTSAAKAKRKKKETVVELPRVLVDTHGLYIVAPRDVAQRMNVHFVDANRITHLLEDSLGEEGSKKLHMIYAPGEHPAIPQGRQDNTHYNIYGAHMVAQRLADALCNEIPLLSRYRTSGDVCNLEKTKH